MQMIKQAIFILLILGIFGYGEYLLSIHLFHSKLAVIGMLLLFFSPFFISNFNLPFEVKRIIHYIGYIFMGLQLYWIPMAYIYQFHHYHKAFFILPLLICIYGIYNCMHIVYTNYTIQAPFQSKIVLISDVHLGYQIGEKQFKKMIEKVNAVEADYILIAGDLVDMNYDVVIEQNLLPMLDQFNAPVYLSLGNHDNYTHRIKDLKQELANTKVTVLDEQQIQLDQFSIIGRNDSQFSSKPLSDYDLSGYTIVLDHTPSRIDESIQNQINLHCSGHTHNGQLFPLQLITNSIFKVGYGHQVFNNTEVVVSGGIGYWGPMNKSSGPCEVVVLNLGE